MDLNEEDWKEALKAKGWDPTAPTIYVLEGFLYYLPIEKVETCYVPSHLCHNQTSF